LRRSEAACSCIENGVGLACGLKYLLSTHFRVTLELPLLVE
jgi:hypothetical protein